MEQGEVQEVRPAADDGGNAGNPGSASAHPSTGPAANAAVRGGRHAAAAVGIGQAERAQGH